MTRPRVAVLRAPGTNCDIETARAFELCGAQAERLHLFALLEQPQRLREFQVLCIPGGFSYGDDIGAGIIFGTQLRVHLGGAVSDFLQRDTLVLGICNGFQVLLKSGILPAGAEGWSPQHASQRDVTLTWNTNGRYTCRWVNLQVTAPRNVFLQGLTEFELPIAHAEGRLAVRNPGVLSTWRQTGQAALCYARRPAACEDDDDSSVSVGAAAGCADAAAALGNSSSAGEASACGASTAVHESNTALAADGILPFPDNPNGSFGNLAGLGDPSGRILGLMPHPERFLFASQHPRWSRRPRGGHGAGRRLFENAVAYFQ